MRAYDAKTGELGELMTSHEAGVQCLVLTRDRAFSGGADGFIKVWDLTKIG